MSEHSLVGRHIADLKPYRPGPPPCVLKEELEVDTLVRLDSNENPLGPSPKAVDAIRRAATELHRYPDGGAMRLKQALAKHLMVSPSQLVIGNGSNELIELLITTFAHSESEILTSKGSFIAYKLAACARGVNLREAALDEGLGYDCEALLANVNDNTRIVFLANPNNPTGTYLDRESLHDFITRLDEKCGANPPLLVIDEAYREYVEDPEPMDSIALLKSRPRTLVLRTFSKAYGLAGVRCGYAVATPEVVSHIESVRAPFNVNALAQEAAIAALEDKAYLQASVSMNARNREWLSTELRRRGLEVIESQTNFILVDFKERALEIYEALRARGVLTRPMVGYGLSNYIRIGIGRDEEQNTLVRALDALTQSTML